MNLEPQKIDWNAEVTTTPEQEYRVLLKSLRRAQGFKLLFVQCSPAEGARLIKQVRDDLPQKRIEVLALKEPITNLYELVAALPHKDQLDVLVISGLEHSLYDYEKERLWSEDGIYRFDAAADKQRYETGVPRVLSHLNLSRERFQRDFPFSFVFLVPTYALKYLSRRAPDFFDWRSGVLEFVTDKQLVEQESQRIVLEGDYQQYLTWTPQARTQRILEIQSLLGEPYQTPERKVQLLLEQGNLSFASQDYNAAIASFDRLLALDPDDHEAWYWQGNVLFSLGRTEDAIASFDRLLALEPDNYAAWYRRGFVLRNLGRTEDAIASYDRAVALQPDDHKAWTNRGLALFSLGRYEDAITSYNHAVALQPDDHKAWTNRGNALFSLGRYEDAITSYDHAVALQPDDHDEWNNRGLALFSLGRYEDAITSYDHAVALQPDNHAAWYNRGNALFSLGRYEDAITSYDQAVAIQPDNHAAWYNRGLALYNLGRYEDAIACYDRALAINPDFHQAWYSRSLVLKYLGREEEATESYNKAVALNPDYDKD